MKPLGAKTGTLEGELRRKRRRNSSATKQSNNSIYFAVDQNKKIKEQLPANEYNEIEFSDRVLRLSKKMKLDNYQLIITNKQYYLFKDKSGKFKESNPFKNIESIILSHQSDNFMLIKMKSRKPDVLLCSRRKIQISQVLAHQTSQETSQLTFSITDRFYFNHIDNQRYYMVFTRTTFGVQSSIYKDDNAIQDQSAKKKKK